MLAKRPQGGAFSRPPTGTPWDLGLIICLFLGYVVMGLGSVYSGLRCGKKSAELMWMIRREGLQRGMVPYPAGVVPSKQASDSGIWKNPSETGKGSARKLNPENRLDSTSLDH